MHAAREEADHLAWTRQRLDELGARPSVLNPLWYAGAFAIGWVAGKAGGDRVSLGFVVETERQVEAHLQSHLERLPANDLASRALVRQMQADEARHAVDAEKAGAAALPGPVQGLMRMAAKARRIIDDLFGAFLDDPRLLPPQYQAKAHPEEQPRWIAHYIAGMTDRYAIKEHRRIFAVDAA